jgi:hypothetical protein
MVSNADSSGKAVKINSLFVMNNSESDAITISGSIRTIGESDFINFLNAKDIDPLENYAAISKDAPIFLEEDQALVVIAVSPASNLVFTASYQDTYTNTVFFNARLHVEAVTTTEQLLINNPAGSGNVLIIKSLYISGIGESKVYYHDEDDIGGTSYTIFNGVTTNNTSTIPLNASYDFVLPENSSIGVQATTAGFIDYTASYEVTQND